MEPPSHLKVDVFDASACDIAAVAPEDLHALSVSVGWPHRVADWDHLREVGQGVAACDEIGRVIGSAMWFPSDEGAGTVGMVITSPRLQANGTGMWLMRTLLERTGGQALRLHATRAAQRLYTSLRFRPERIVFQRQGTAAPPAGLRLERNGIVRSLEPDDLPALLSLDASARGARRERVFRSVLARSTGYGLVRDGALAAFALCRGFGRGHLVGPVVAGRDGDAVAVTMPHVMDHAGRFLRLDSHAEGGAFAEFLVGAGLRPYDTVLTMSLNCGSLDAFAEPSGAPALYGLASQALG